MLRFVDMRDARITGITFGFWDTVTDSMFKLGDDQGWETFDGVEESARDAEREDLLPRLRGLCPDWVHRPQTKLSACKELMHRLGVRTYFGDDVRVADIDAAEVRSILQRLTPPDDEGPFPEMFSRVIDTLLREMASES